MLQSFLTSYLNIPLAFASNYSVPNVGYHSIDYSVFGDWDPLIY